MVKVSYCQKLVSNSSNKSLSVTESDPLPFHSSHTAALPKISLALPSVLYTVGSGICSG